MSDHLAIAILAIALFALARFVFSHLIRLAKQSSVTLIVKIGFWFWELSQRFQIQELSAAVANRPEGMLTEEQAEAIIEFSKLLKRNRQALFFCDNNGRKPVYEIMISHKGNIETSEVVDEGTYNYFHTISNACSKNIEFVMFMSEGRVFAVRNGSVLGECFPQEIVFYDEKIAKTLAT